MMCCYQHKAQRCNIGADAFSRVVLLKHGAEDGGVGDTAQVDKPLENRKGEPP